MDSLSVSDMCAGESWRGGLPHSPSHESVTTDLSLFSVSSAASDAKILRLLACKAGQGPDPSLRGVSPNPDAKNNSKPSTYMLQQADSCRSLLCGCAALCAALGLRRSFSAGDVAHPTPQPGAPLRNATSTVCLLAALAPASRASSARAELPSPQKSRPRHDLAVNNKVRQSYIRRRLLSTYRALERMSQSEFNLDKLEAAAVSAVTSAVSPGPTSLAVPPVAATTPKTSVCRFMHPEAAHLALTTAEVDLTRGRPLSKYERNMMIFNWLHTLDAAADN